MRKYKLEEGMKVTLKPEFKERFMDCDGEDFLGGINPLMVDIYKKKGFLVVGEVGNDKFFYTIEDGYIWDSKWFEPMHQKSFVEKKLESLIKELQDFKALETMKRETKEREKARITKPSYDIAIDSDGIIEIEIDGKIGTAKVNKEVDTYNKAFGMVIATARACGLDKDTVDGIIDVLYGDCIELEELSTKELMEELSKRLK